MAKRKQTTPKKTAGQPPKPNNERRTIKKEVAYSPDEWAKLEAMRGSMKAATFIRKRSLGEL